MENDLARKHGVPKWLRQYNKRYAKGGIAALVQCHIQAEAEAARAKKKEQDNGR